MSVLKLKAKVKLASEEDMELEELDMGIIAKSKEWVWRPVAISVREIYKIIGYSSTKSIVQMYDGEKMLVAEVFDDLCARWEKAVDELTFREVDLIEYNEEGGSLTEDEE